MQELRDVLENYLLTKKELGGRTKKGVTTADNLAIRETLPDFFKGIISRSGRLDDFVVTSSFGKGNIADVPWVGVFNRRVTHSAQAGYYIVLLFSADMTSCTLCLNQGVNALKEKFGTKTARQILKDTARVVLTHFTAHPSANVGPIGLAARGDLGRGYEWGAIESFTYYTSALPSSSELEHDFRILLDHYDTLFSIFGASLRELYPTTEASYQQAALAIAGVQPSGLAESPAAWAPKKQRRTSLGYRRDPSIAAKALAAACFRCEINRTHATFLSRVTGEQFVEAHHIIPISRQGAFKYSLDVTSNVAALCPNCHKLLHHGSFVEKRPALEALFEDRQAHLKKAGISVAFDDLLRMYQRDLAEEEA